MSKYRPKLERQDSLEKVLRIAEKARSGSPITNEEKKIFKEWESGTKASIITRDMMNKGIPISQSDKDLANLMNESMTNFIKNVKTDQNKKLSQTQPKSLQEQLKECHNELRLTKTALQLETTKRAAHKRHGKVGGGQIGCMNEIMELYKNEPEIINKYAEKVRGSSLEGMPSSFRSFKRLFEKKYKDYKTPKGGTRRNRRDWGRSATEMGARAIFFLLVLLFIFNMIQIGRGLNLDGSPNPGNRMYRLYRFLADPTGLSDLFRITPRTGGSRKKSGGVHVMEPFEKCDSLWELLDESKKDPVAFGNKNLHLVEKYADKDTLSFYKEVLKEGESKIKKGRGRSLSGGWDNIPPLPQNDDDLLYIWVTGVTGVLIWYFIETGPALFGGKRRRKSRKKRKGGMKNSSKKLLNRLDNLGYTATQPGLMQDFYGALDPHDALKPYLIKKQELPKEMNEIVSIRPIPIKGRKVVNPGTPYRRFEGGKKRKTRRKRRRRRKSRKKRRKKKTKKRKRKRGGDEIDDLKRSPTSGVQAQIVSRLSNSERSPGKRFVPLRIAPQKTKRTYGNILPHRKRKEAMKKIRANLKKMDMPKSPKGLKDMRWTKKQNEDHFRDAVLNRRIGKGGRNKRTRKRRRKKKTKKRR